MSGMMILILAQTTGPFSFPDVPPSWTAFVTAIGVAAVSIGALLGLVVKLWAMVREALAQLKTSKQNVQALGAATLANSKAINQSPGPSVSHEVEQAAREIRNDPSKPAAIPVNTDPIPPTLQQRMDFKQAVEESRNPIQ
jgi:hypothetical protein